jgi:pyruvate-formate lyase-activating enzyme
MQDQRPALVFADQKGNIMEFEPIAMVGRSGDYYLPLDQGEVIALPPGAQLYVLPDRHPVGMERETGQLVVLEENPYAPGTPALAVAAFLPAAYTQTYLSAWKRNECAAVLPLFAYSAVGWQDGFVTTAVRVDLSQRQDPEYFDLTKARAGTQNWQAKMPNNRLVKHLSHCAIGYGCPAALNLFQGREEAPLPTSPGCNAGCLGCISLQEKCEPPAPQERIAFIPTPQEIAEVALKHIAAVEQPVVSFGQGCEGEPLLVADTICEAIRLIRSQTPKGTINLNTNASLPERIAELAEAGLDSLRISMNSPRSETYKAYFRPRYAFEALKESAWEMKRRGKFVSINLFVFPGLTDAPKEAQALQSFITENNIDMIQWRNLNIDPDLYLETLGQTLPAGIGIRRLIDEIPVRRGYFNPFVP